MSTEADFTSGITGSPRLMLQLQNARLRVYAFVMSLFRRKMKVRNICEPGRETEIEVVTYLMRMMVAAYFFTSVRYGLPDL